MEKEAEIVRFMFDAYLEGKSTTEIATALTIAKVPTPKGKTVWQAAVVCSILHNEKYMGEMRMQKTVTVDLFTHKIKKIVDLRISTLFAIIMSRLYRGVPLRKYRKYFKREATGGVERKNKKRGSSSNRYAKEP